MTLTPDELSDDPACPKCQRRRSDETTNACSRCGLVFSYWSPDKAAQVIKLDDKGDQLWRAVRHSWKDESKHDAFLKYCSMANLLAAAGRCYRLRLDKNPEDEMALAMQARIIGMATLSFARPSAPKKPVTRTQWFWVVLIVGVIGGTLASFVINR